MILVKGRIIDGNGGEPVDNGLVAIDNNRIAAVCKAHEYPIPPHAEVIEVKNGTILPGLIDLHVHLALGANFYDVYKTHNYHVVCRAIQDMKKMLNAGFTSMAECGGLSNYLKAPWEEGLITGPRIFSAGRCFVQSGGHFDFIKEFPIEYTKHPDRNPVSQIVDGVDEVRRESRRHFREGADFLKIMVSAGVVSQGNKFHVQEFSDSEIRAFVEEAENYGTYVSAHAHSEKGIKAALRCGVKRIEHASFMDERDIEDMVRLGIWYVPTLATGYQFLNHLDQLQPWVVEKEKAADGHLFQYVKKAIDAGVIVGCGADFGGDALCPHGMNGLEIRLLHEIGGMTPMEAIQTATKTSAMMLLREGDLGTLEPGKLADLIVVDGDPLSDLNLLVGPDHVRVVIQDGLVRKNK